ncbi:MAG: hypothetical protein QM759_04965 [Terricaulis sp.]
MTSHRALSGWPLFPTSQLSPPCNVFIFVSDTHECDLRIHEWTAVNGALVSESQYGRTQDLVTFMSAHKATLLLFTGMLASVPVIAPALFAPGAPNGEAVIGDAQALSLSVLQVDDTLVKLDGVSVGAVNPNLDAERRKQFEQFVSRGEVICRVHSGVEGDASGLRPGHCFASGVDVGQWLIENGYATAGLAELLRYAPSQGRAAALRLGIWGS